MEQLFRDLFLNSIHAKLAGEQYTLEKRDIVIDDDVLVIAYDIVKSNEHKPYGICPKDNSPI